MTCRVLCKMFGLHRTGTVSRSVGKNFLGASEVRPGTPRGEGTPNHVGGRHERCPTPTSTFTRTRATSARHQSAASAPHHLPYVVHSTHTAFPLPLRRHPLVEIPSSLHIASRPTRAWCSPQHGCKIDNVFFKKLPTARHTFPLAEREINQLTPQS